MNPKVYDSIIIGGGPAGLSAAIYLARFNRSALVIDSAEGRWQNHEINENYLGFPTGISARELRDRGLQQAQHFGAEYLHDTVVHVDKLDTSSIDPRIGGRFRVDCSASYHAQSLIFANGVKDLFPNFLRWQEYLGISLFWCITCDGFKVRNKSLVIVGHDEETACTALQFLQFTPRVAVVTNISPGEERFGTKWLERLAHFNIPIYRGQITEVMGRSGYLTSLTLDSGQTLTLDYMFNLQGSVPCSELAQGLGVTVDEKGFIITDADQKTNVSFVYAAGDVTKAYAHQIVTAAHEGSMAAQAANYDLYLPEQRL